MSKEYVYLSFFKSNKVNYIYHSKSQTIEFACIYCHGKAAMNSRTSEWKCRICSESGNLVTLINFAKHNTFGEIYVPNKEKQSIFRMLDRLSNKYPEENRLVLLEQKVKELIKYYEKNTV